MSIRSEMPVLARHEGAWTGTYLHMDIDGRELDRHLAHLQCSFPDDGPYAYYQVNTYEWADGRREEIHFPATYRDRQVFWDTDRILGRAWEVDPRTVMLTWTRKGEPQTYLYEMIQISDDGQNRGRTWHWFENDLLVRRTCIKEKRVR